MISGQHRFHGYRSLGLVFRRGVTVRNQYMSLKFVRNERRSVYRVAVIVGRKAHKSAVRRNRVRRRIYEVIRKNDQGITEPFDLIVTVFSDQLAEQSPDQVSDLVLGLLRQAGVLQTTVSPALPHAIVKAKEEKA